MTSPMQEQTQPELQAPEKKRKMLRRRRRSWRRVVLALLIWALLGLAVSTAVRTFATEPATTDFQRTWSRTDEPVKSGLVRRTWMWGDGAFTGPMEEPYVEGVNGSRTVQYFDKSRMEDNSYRASAPWDVTNGLLVVEMVTGRLQLDDASFEQHAPATGNVAGDQDDPSGVTYQTLAGLLNAPARADGALITERIDQTGKVTDDPAMSSYGVTAAYRVTAPGIDHQVASEFWKFMNMAGLVYEDGSHVTAPLFLNPFYATGLPITEAYWSTVKVAGTYQDVLLQCFERRCLTYTPGNDPGWQVEAGNVGQHYYSWRYGQTPPPVEGTPQPDATATETVEPTATVTPSDEQVEPYVFAAKWGGPIDPDAAFVSPYGVGESDDGFIYVTDGGTDRVMKFTTAGAFVKMWGESGQGNSQFANPQGVAVDSAGNVYVADSGNHLIKKFDSNGNYLDEFNGEGSTTPPFSFPNSVAVDRFGNIYVTDAGNRRVVKLDSTGTFVDAWDAQSSNGGTFASVSGIDVDAIGYIYVLDHADCRVVQFNQYGQIFGEWDTSTTCGFERPGGLSVNPTDGYIYVTDSYEKTLLGFDPGGVQHYSYGYAEASNSVDHFPGLAVGANNMLYLVDHDEKALLKEEVAGGINHRDQWNDGRRGWFADDTFGMARDNTGNIYVSDDTYDRIQKFDSNGQLLDVFSDPGQFEDPNALATSLDGFLYVADVLHDRIVKLTLDGVYVDEWGETGTVDGKFQNPRGLATDAAGNVYVVDSVRNRVQKFDSTGTILKAWGQPGEGDAQFDAPSDIVVDNGRVYVADTQNDRVQVFDPDGNHLATWDGTNSPVGPFNNPKGIGINAEGNIFIVDTGNDRVQVYSPDGNHLTQFGIEGSTDGTFDAPSRVEIGVNGEAYILDTGNNRVQVFGQLSKLK